MNRYINCIAHNSSEGNVIIGNKQTALVDCGMAFCAGDTIQKVKDALNGRPLDYIFFTHAHYDHIGALPFFRKEWPHLRTVTSAAGAELLLKDTPRRIIREYSLAAAAIHGITVDTTYSDDVFHADVTVKEGDRISLGAITVEILETPGHTRDSLSFFIPELEVLVLNETMGVLMPDGSVFPSYLTSYTGTIASIEKCRQIPCKLLSLPHRGIVCSEDAYGFFDKALVSNTACCDFILKMKENGLNEDEMQDSFYKQYSSEILLSLQPKEAFIANARATILCTLKGK